MATTTKDTTERLKAAVQKRDRLATKTERLRGRLEEAHSNLATVESQCRDKNINPDQIDDKVDQLRTEYASAVDGLETRLHDIEEALSPFEA